VASSYRWRQGDASWIAAAAAAALLLSLIFPLTAFKWGPLTLPGLLIIAGLAVATLSRPEIGIATALVLVPLGNYGVLNTGPLDLPAWLIEALWDTFVFSVAALRLRQRTEMFPRMGVALIVYWGVTLLGFATAVSQNDALPILRANTVGLLLFFATAFSIRDRRAALWVVGGLAASGALVGAVAAYEHWSGAVTTEGFFSSSGHIVSRAAAGFGTANALGGFLVILVPFLAAGALLVQKGRSLFLGALVLAVLGIWASYSRGALLGLAVVPLFFVPRRYLAWAIPTLIVFALVATPGLVKERFSELSSSSPDVATRVDIWTTARDIWEQHPLIGVGVGGFPLAYSEAHLPGKQFLPGTIFQPPPHAHNLFLQQLAETGLLGFFSLIVVLVLALHTSLMVRRSRTHWVSVMGTACLASVTAFLIHNLFDVTLLEGTGVYMFVILGLASALLVVSRAEEGQRAEARPSPVGPVPASPVWEF
jgi:O-antigen ligase